MKDKLTVAFGDTTVELNLLTLRQLQDIEAIFVNGLRPERGNLGPAVDILKIALAKDFKEIADKLDELPATKKQLLTASENILEFGGFIEINTKGEWTAAVSGRNSGAKSTAA